MDFLKARKDVSISEKKQAIVKKAKRLMVPYFFLTVVTALLKLLFGAFARNPLNYSTLAVDVLIGRNNPNHCGEKLWMLLSDYGMDIYMIGYYVQQAIFVVCGKILGFDYLVYAWMMLIFGLIAPIFLSKYVVRKNHMLSTLILGR